MPELLRRHARPTGTRHPFSSGRIPRTTSRCILPFSRIAGEGGRDDAAASPAQTVSRWAGAGGLTGQADSAPSIVCPPRTTFPWSALAHPTFIAETRSGRRRGVAVGWARADGHQRAEIANTVTTAPMPELQRRQRRPTGTRHPFSSGRIPRTTSRCILPFSRIAGEGGRDDAAASPPLTVSRWAGAGGLTWQADSAPPNVCPPRTTFPWSALAHPTFIVPPSLLFQRHRR